ncbi:MAG: type III-B CRISPR module RAMP protein Cmr4 [Ktedonobacteraceae bacterium]
MITSTLYLYTETSLHAGVGSGLSSIDLPIQRERTTQYPMIQSSGIKGKLRAAREGNRNDLTDAEKELVDVVFGPPAINGAGSDHAGALITGDARILLFPVRSLNGVFAYTTSYDVLSRFKRDLEREQTEAKANWTLPDVVKDKVFVTTKSDIHSNGTIVLEEFSFDTQSDERVDTIAEWIAKHALPDFASDYWPNKVKTSLAILPNDVFRDFALYATEVITRVRIDRDKKTVERGALWTEEHLPTDTLLYVPLYATKARKKASMVTEKQVLAQIETLNNKHLQLGGDETVGRGLVRVRLGHL